jgi:hypothetical protein
MTWYRHSAIEESEFSRHARSILSHFEPLEIQVSCPKHSWLFIQNLDLSLLRKLKVDFFQGHSIGAEAKLVCPLLEEIALDIPTIADVIQVLAALRTSALWSLSVNLTAELNLQEDLDVTDWLQGLDSDSRHAITLGISLPSVRSATWRVLPNPGKLPHFRFLHHLTPKTRELRLAFDNVRAAFNSRGVVRGKAEDINREVFFDENAFRALCASLQPTPEGVPFPYLTYFEGVLETRMEYEEVEAARDTVLQLLHARTAAGAVPLRFKDLKVMPRDPCTPDGRKNGWEIRFRAAEEITAMLSSER